jgi:hypothetical protein
MYNDSNPYPIKLALEHLLDGLDTQQTDPIKADNHFRDSISILCLYVNTSKLKNKELLNILK